MKTQVVTPRPPPVSLLRGALWCLFVRRVAAANDDDDARRAFVNIFRCRVETVRGDGSSRVYIVNAICTGNASGKGKKALTLTHHHPGVEVEKKLVKKIEKRKNLALSFRALYLLRPVP